MTRFRPCIDIHEGKVKQIVGGTLSDSGQGLKTNFVSDKAPAYYAGLYRKDGLQGGHVIQLGPGNEAASLEALGAYPGGLQIGGGIHLENAERFIEAGASHVIVTSWIFPEGRLDLARVEQLSRKVGKERLVVDLSCRKVGGGWNVAMNRWQTLTDIRLDAGLFSSLAPLCDEFLVHAADVEGHCRGIDLDLVRLLADLSPLPITYAGGANSLRDLEAVARESRGKVDLSIGSALDIFGGNLIRYADCVRYNRPANRRGDVA